MILHKNYGAADCLLWARIKQKPVTINGPDDNRSSNADSEEDAGVGNDIQLTFRFRGRTSEKWLSGRCMFLFSIIL
jgi:hypothetical protein